jgi:hypothetical protein
VLLGGMGRLKNRAKNSSSQLKNTCLSSADRFAQSISGSAARSSSALSSKVLRAGIAGRKVRATGGGPEDGVRDAGGAYGALALVLARGGGGGGAGFPLYGSQLVFAIGTLEKY